MDTVRGRDAAAIAGNNWKEHFNATRDVLKSVTKHREDHDSSLSRSLDRMDVVPHRKRNYYRDDTSMSDYDARSTGGDQSASDYGASGDDISVTSHDSHPAGRHNTSCTDSGMGSTDLKWVQERLSAERPVGTDEEQVYESIPEEMMTPLKQEHRPLTYPISPSDYQVQWDDDAEIYLDGYSPQSAAGAPLHSTLIGSAHNVSAVSDRSRAGSRYHSRGDPSGMEDPRPALPPQRKHCRSQESLARHIHHDDSILSSRQHRLQGVHSMECLEDSLGSTFSSHSLMVQQGSILSDTIARRPKHTQHPSSGSVKPPEQPPTTKTKPAKELPKTKPAKTKSGPFKFLKCCRPAKNKTAGHRPVTTIDQKQKKVLNGSHYSLESIDDRLGGGLMVDLRGNCMGRDNRGPIVYPQQHPHYPHYPPQHMHHPQMAPCFGCHRREPAPNEWVGYNQSQRRDSIGGYDSDSTAFMAMRMCKPGVTEAVCRGPPVVGARWSMRGPQAPPVQHQHNFQQQLQDIDENFTTLALM